MRLSTLRRLRIAAAAALFAVLLPTPSFATPVGDDGPGVYLKLVQNAKLPFDQVARTLEGTLAGEGWTVLARMDCGVDASACQFRSRVIVAYPAGYPQRLLAHGPQALYAIPIRFVVWEDENGVNVGATNPMNLNRTIVDEASTPGTWADVATAMRAVARKAFPDQQAGLEYGQTREKSRIGRTMGVMAGGLFADKLKDVVVQPANGLTASAVAGRLADGMADVPGDWEWDAHAVYVIDLPEFGMAILGVTGETIEARSAGIVRHGGDNARKDMACPGIDHAAAYPIEVGITVVNGELKIQMVDEMYRMKMFFEDAGKMAFMKNMGMPGSIEDEVKNKIRAVLR